MSIKRLKEVFRIVLAEAERNEPFRQEIEKAFAAASGMAATAPAGKKVKAKNRRDPAILNPYEAIKQGEQSLTTELQALSIEQLKDVVSHFAIDSTKLALKWKSRERLIDLIVTTTKGRLEKGDAFRPQL